MASGCACVSSDIGGCVDLITHEKTGLLFTVGNALKMKKEVIRLLNDEELLKNISSNALSLIKTKYEINIIVQKLIELYKSLKKS